MATRRKTLPKEFEEVLETGTLAEQKALLERCEANARTRDLYERPALCFPGIGVELAAWLIDRGCDVDGQDRFGDTPLLWQVSHERSEGSFVRNMAVTRLLVERGADVDLGAPLARAAHIHDARGVRILLGLGSDVEQRSSLQGRTPLEEALATCANAYIVPVADVVRALLAAGARVTPRMADDVRRIGKDFERYRGIPSFDANLTERTDRALAYLYRTFGVEPVVSAARHDGVSPIEVPEGSWRHQFDALWDALVPPTGRAATVQGEVVRICGKVAHEILDNGGMNWDADFRALARALPAYLALGNRLEAADESTVGRLARDVGASSDEGDLDRFAKLVVRWVQLNPGPIALADIVDDPARDVRR